MSLSMSELCGAHKPRGPGLAIKNELENSIFPFPLGLGGGSVMQIQKNESSVLLCITLWGCD